MSHTQGFVCYRRLCPVGPVCNIYIVYNPDEYDKLWSLYLWCRAAETHFSFLKEPNREEVACGWKWNLSSPRLFESTECLKSFKVDGVLSSKRAQGPALWPVWLADSSCKATCRIASELGAATVRTCTQTGMCRHRSVHARADKGNRLLRWGGQIKTTAAGVLTFSIVVALRGQNRGRWSRLP